MYGKRLSRAVAVTAVSSLVIVAATFAADLKSDLLLGTNGIQQSKNLGASLVGGSSGSFTNNLFINGAGITYPVDFEVASSPSFVTSVGSGQITAVGDTNAEDSIIAYTIPCALGGFTGRVQYAATAASGTVGVTTAWVDISGTVTSLGSSCDTPPANNSPTADAGDDVSGAEGSAIAIDGSGSSDPDAGDDLTYLWTIDATGIDASGSCSIGDDTAAQTSVTCDDDSNDATDQVFTLTLTVTDESDASDTDTALVNVTNANPSLDSVAFIAASGACPALDANGDPIPNASLSFAGSDVGLNDILSYTVDWGDGSDPESATSPSSHAYTAAGTYAASVTVEDDDGGSDSDSTDTGFRVDYNTSGILQPINTTGTRSLFKAGSTIPVKIRITNCDGSVPSLAPAIAVQMLSGSVPSGSDEPIYSTVPDQGTTMRLSDGQYIYNLGTKTPFTPDPTATYRIYITVQPGQVVSADFGLKK